VEPCWKSFSPLLEFQCLSFCLLCELDATICVIQNVDTIYVICANIRCIYLKSMTYVSKICLKDHLKMQGCGPNTVRRWGSYQAQMDICLFVVYRRSHTDQNGQTRYPNCGHHITDQNRQIWCLKCSNPSKVA
jgi:hypothetical protein